MFYIAAVELEFQGETKLDVCYVCAERMAETGEKIGPLMREKWPGCDIRKMIVRQVEQRVLMDVVGKDMARALRMHGGIRMR